MRFVIIAGEASGDLHGSNLVRALKALQPGADFRFFGGEKMAAVTPGLVKDYKEMAFMGFLEVLTHLGSIRKNLSAARRMIQDFRPDAVILIDYPGFNLRIAAFTKMLGIPVFFYISPKVWAWKQSRIPKIRETVDRMFCILPFEVGFYKDHGMEVSYHGNPVLDEVSRYQSQAPSRTLIRKKLNLGNLPLILLAPGSRKQELHHNLPPVLTLVQRFPGYRFVIAGAPGLSPGDYAPYLKDMDIPVIFGKFYDLLSVAEAAVVTSGTATLETALMGVPQVVVYKGNAVSYAIAKRLVKVDYISLVNLIADRPVIRELIQDEVKPESIAAETEKLLKGGVSRKPMLERYRTVKDILGNPGVSEKVAREIIGRLEKPEK